MLLLVQISKIHLLNIQYQRSFHHSHYSQKTHVDQVGQYLCNICAIFSLKDLSCFFFLFQIRRLMMISDLWVQFGPLERAAPFWGNCGGYSSVNGWWVSSFTNELVLMATVKSLPESCKYSRDEIRNISAAVVSIFVYLWQHISFIQNLFSKVKIVFDLFRLLTHVISHSNTVWIKFIRIWLIFIPSLKPHWSTIHPP